MTKPHWTTAQDQLRDIIHAPRFGILTDFDGTLAPFRPYPEMPHMSERNVHLISELARRLPLVALVSGRAADELRDVASLPPDVSVAYVGNHGLEELIDGQIIVAPEALPFEPRMKAFHQDLGVPLLPAVRHQYKRITLSVTYRQATDLPGTRALLKEKLDQVNADYGFLLHEGRTIWEVKPPVELDKGTAIKRLIAEHRLDSAIFLGDDLTDVPALNAIRELRAAGTLKGLSVAVLGDTVVAPVQEAADVIADSVDTVTTILEWILTELSGTP